MLDFLNLVELFERHGVTFVSVTQSFNTKDAMGRMALNILVTFAQFEREADRRAHPRQGRGLPQEGATGWADGRRSATRFATAN